MGLREGKRIFLAAQQGGRQGPRGPLWEARPRRTQHAVWPTLAVGLALLSPRSLVSFQLELAGTVEDEAQHPALKSPAGTPLHGPGRPSQPCPLGSLGLCCPCRGRCFTPLAPGAVRLNKRLVLNKSQGK